MDWKKVIDEAMARTGLRQAGLAARAGCTQPHISYLRNKPGAAPSYLLGQILIELANARPATQVSADSGIKAAAEQVAPHA